MLDFSVFALRFLMGFSLLCLCGNSIPVFACSRFFKASIQCTDYTKIKKRLTCHCKMNFCPWDCIYSRSFSKEALEAHISLTCLFSLFSKINKYFLWKVTENAEKYKGENFNFPLTYPWRSFLLLSFCLLAMTKQANSCDIYTAEIMPF